MDSKLIFQKHIFLPQDHGSWVFVFSPIIAGFNLGGWGAAQAWIAFSAVAFFLLRQPLTVVVKALSGRRDRRDLPPSILWSSVYGVALISAIVGMILTGQTYVVYWMAAPAVLMLAWQFWMVVNRVERKQRTFEVLSTGLLAFIAAAMVWVKGKPFDTDGFILWLFLFLQAAASIYYAYTRLEQRGWKNLPEIRARWDVSAGTLVFTGCNLIVAAWLGVMGLVGSLLWVAFTVQLLETIYSVNRPAMGFKPTAIGFRQLAVSVVFLALFLVFWK